MRRWLLLWSSAILTGTTISASTENPCQKCHAAQVSGYVRSAMARSLSRSVGPQQGSFVHKLSGTKVTITPAGKTIQITMARAGASGSLPVEYVIGSGTHAYGYLLRKG